MLVLERPRLDAPRPRAKWQSMGAVSFVHCRLPWWHLITLYIALHSRWKPCVYDTYRTRNVSTECSERLLVLLFCTSTLSSLCFMLWAPSGVTLSSDPVAWLAANHRLHRFARGRVSNGDAETIRRGARHMVPFLLLAAGMVNVG
ncbi:hypothetical protein DICVIV_11217 [Dictyocaulus viviparus]|uniref:Uncharacterized protein n=1 Tax=Dictyocaulus viviparus TaxID=29172 RepID=A0A0D8XKF0_DICVI|nr:hypothetical protein DICVIV_11217 [Dictyocaulus viviparus]